MQTIDITPETAKEHTLFCIKDVKSEGFKAKLTWLEKAHTEGLRIKMLKSDDNKPIAYIEYVPGEFAWRPVNAKEYLFIHCLYVYAKKDRQQGLGKQLIDLCIEEAKAQGKAGICVMSSNGAWVASKELFIKNGFEQVDAKGRFELMCLKFDKKTASPKLIDWTENHSAYEGWHLVYSNQCPWHKKAVDVLQKVGLEHNIQLITHEITSAKEAQESPSGFGTFSLLKDGKLLEDHYISETRFKNILKKEAPY